MNQRLFFPVNTKLLVNNQPFTIDRIDGDRMYCQKQYIRYIPDMDHWESNDKQSITSVKAEGYKWTRQPPKNHICGPDNPLSPWLQKPDGSIEWIGYRHTLALPAKI